MFCKTKNIKPSFLKIGDNNHTLSLPSQISIYKKKKELKMVLYHCILQGWLMKEKKGGEGNAVSPKPLPQVTISKRIISYIVCRVPICTLTKHLKCDYIRIQPKRKLSSSFLILSPTILVFLPLSFSHSLWYYKPQMRQRLLQKISSWIDTNSLLV